MRRTRQIALGVGGLLLATATTSIPAQAGTAAHGGAAHHRDNAVVTWNANAGAAALAACIAPADDPLHESRMYAIMHLAIHDALNAIDRRSQPYAFRGHAHARTSSHAAVAAAARDTLVATIGEIPAPFPQSCRDAGLARVEADYTAALAAVPEAAEKARGVSVGRAAAAAVLAMRIGDGSDTVVIDTGYPQGTQPGQYRFTPGAEFAFAPGWADVRPFTLRSADQFKPGPPPTLGSRRYARDVNEVQRLGGDGVTTPTSRTAQQTETALFWLESSPLAWNRLARTIVTDRRVDLWGSARLFGLLNMALADGYIGSFDTKYAYAYWRPVTAIRAADTDGNDRTVADPTWTPLRPTPPIPDYDSAHAAEGGAATAVLRGFFGTDRIAVTACSRTLPAGSTCTDASPVLRQYQSLSSIARENAESRILIGFHFRSAAEAGLRHGARIGDQAVEQFLRPTGSTP